MGVTNWVIDKSALVRLDGSPDVERWLERIQRGLVHVTSVTLLEIGFSARSARDLRQRARRPPASLMPLAYMTRQSEDRALEVQGLLADRGLHRGPAVPDLLLAATAELSRLTILHVDKDFELIAGVTGQPVERLAVG